MSYQVPQHIDNNKVFIVNRSEIEGRLEPEFYRPSLSLLENRIRSLATHRLRDYALSLAGGATPPKTESDKFYSDSENGIPFLRVQNLQTNGELSLDDCVYINEDTHNGLLKRSQVAEGDLLVKITGVGRMAVASVAPKGFVGNTNQHMVVIKTGDISLSKYLARYLNLDIIEKIASRHSTGGTRPALDYPSLKNIPVIEGIDFTQIDKGLGIVKKKELESQELLTSIDNYLLNELGITLPKIKFDLKNRIFISSHYQIIGKRIDPIYTLCWGKSARSNKYNSISLRVIADICKGNALTGDNVVPGIIPVIAGGQTSPYSHNKSNYQGNVITVSASGAYAGYVWYHPNPIYATDCCVIRSKDENAFLTEYIFEVLKVQQESIYWLQTGAAQPHVYASDLESLVIPVIPLPQQQKIVEYTKEIRLKAKTLQEEGKHILELAKQEVERMIIAESTQRNRP